LESIIKYLTTGQWQVLEYKFKVPGWHTDLTNSIYHFTENEVMITLNNAFNHKILSSYSINDKAITLNSGSFSFNKISETTFELENENLYLLFKLKS
jgi:hypothetical protein